LYIRSPIRSTTVRGRSGVRVRSTVRACLRSNSNAFRFA
jgi:hypothetical protein